MKQRDGAAAEFRRRIGLDDGLHQRVRADVGEADDHHQHRGDLKPGRGGKSNHADAVESDAAEHAQSPWHAVAESRDNHGTAEGADPHGGQEQTLSGGADV